MRITVLGKSPSWQDVDGACSGYLVEEQGCRLLIDCGNGVFSKLRRFADYVDVDAVVISHLHADHFLDLVPFSYALTYGPRSAARRRAARRCTRPPGARDCFRRVVGAWGNEDLIENAFELREYDPADVLHAGPLTVRFQAVPHFVRHQRGRGHLGRERRRAVHLRRGLVAVRRAVRVRARHGPAADRGHAARARSGRPRGHLTAAEAGEHGRRAGARRLVLTHLTDELDAARAEEEAERTFGGPVEIAREGAVYEL